MTAPWGTSKWGVAQWGGGTSPVTLSLAYAISTNEILVQASGDLLMRSPVLKGDATNPSTWRVVRLDQNVILPVVSAIARSPTQVVIRCLSPLPSNAIQLQVSAQNLLDASAGLVSAPRTATFLGVVETALSTPSRALVTATNGARDLLNRQVPTSSGSLSGTLVIRGGDYENQTGTDLLRKLVIRRLIAAPGDFLHLPTYGVGLRVKQPIPASDLVRLQAEIRRQISLEPEVSQVRATVTQSGNSLTVAVLVTVRATGEKLDIGVPFTLAAAA